MSSDLQLFGLFPGPLKVMCEDQDTTSTQDLKNILQEIGREHIVDFLLLWFNTWQTKGHIVPCTLTHSDQLWSGWYISSCHNANELFHACVTQQLWDLLDWCYRVQPNQFQLNWEKISLTYSRSGHLKAVQWLYQTNHLTNVENCFTLSCCFGHLQVAQWLYSLGGRDDMNVNIHIRDDYAFRNSCGHGYLHVAQWLYSLDRNIDIHKKNEDAFRWSCFNGHLQVAQWLYSLGDVNIHACDEEAFLVSCEKGQLHVAQWLYSLGDDVNIHAKNDYAFRHSCLNNHLQVAQWLYSLGGHDINDDRDVVTVVTASSFVNYTRNEYAFMHSCISGHLEMAQWLHSLGVSKDKAPNDCPPHVQDWLNS